MGTVMQGGTNLAFNIYQKYKDGKNIWEYEQEDFKELGFDFVKEGSKGYISGASIYGMTNVLKFSAPAASAMTSGTFGLINSISMYRTNQVDDDGFINSIISNTIDATGAAIGASMGQLLIPVPVLGALLGSTIISTSIKLGENILNKKEIELLLDYENQIQAHVQKLDDDYKLIYEALIDKYNEIKNLQDISFDLTTNLSLRFQSSVDLAHVLDVDENIILDSLDKVDDYFMS